MPKQDFSKISNGPASNGMKVGALAHARDNHLADIYQDQK